MKKVISLVLTFVMLISMLSGLNVTALAGSSDGFEYELLEDGTAQITGYENDEVNSLSVPSVIDGYTVTSLADCFVGFYNLKSVVLPQTLTSINGSFGLCESLKEITIPNSVTFIGEGSFWDCIMLREIVIPNGVNGIASNAFGDCASLERVTLGNGIEYIGEAAFKACYSLRNIYIPEGVKEIHQQAFEGCSSLSSVFIPHTVNFIDYGAFEYCSSLKSVIMPDGITTIMPNTFLECGSLEFVAIPESVTEIAECAFTECSSLAKVHYCGSESDWLRVFVANEYESNNYLLNAELEYNHIDDEGDVISEPSCTKNGEIIYHCIICLKSRTEEIPATDHDIEILEYCGPSCTEYGWTEGRRCRKCGETLAYQEQIAPLGHKWDKGEVTKKATISSNGVITYHCMVGPCTEAKTSGIAKISSVKLSKTSYTYNGNAKKPTVTVKDSKGKTIASSNYSVKYSKNTKPGKAAVTITFKGNYDGKKTLNFTINPKGTRLSKLTASKKGFTVKWNKQSTQTTGYQIQYATDSKFTKNKKTVTVSKNSTTSKKITGLKSKKKYYVRIRTYKTVDGKKYYSSWSDVKTVKTK